MVRKPFTAAAAAKVPFAGKSGDGIHPFPTVSNCLEKKGWVPKLKEKLEYLRRQVLRNSAEEECKRKSLKTRVSRRDLGLGMQRARRNSINEE
jgi:hypothetical protein